MNEAYRTQVALLIRMMPSIYKIEDFAVHGGTAINLFVKNLPRYSIDIDLTYLPVKNREDSLQEINNHLNILKQRIEETIPGIRIVHRSSVWKLLCTKDDAMVKIEVNGTKRGIIGTVEEQGGNSSWIKKLIDHIENFFIGIGQGFCFCRQTGEY